MPPIGLRSTVSSRLLSEFRQQFRKLVHFRTYRHVAFVEWRFLLDSKLTRAAAIGLQFLIAVELVALSLKWLPAPPGLLANTNLAGAAAFLLLIRHHHRLAVVKDRYRNLIQDLGARLDDIRDLEWFHDEAERRVALAVRELCKTFNEASGQPAEGPYRFFADVLLETGGSLQRFVAEPFTGYRPDGAMPASEGAAGLALSTGDLVYVPDVRQRHGLRIRTKASQDGRRIFEFELAEDTFLALDGNEPPFRSLLCVPFGRGGFAAQVPRAGVACFGAARAGAFNEGFYFDTAKLATKMIEDTLRKNPRRKDRRISSVAPTHGRFSGSRTGAERGRGRTGAGRGIPPSPELRDPSRGENRDIPHHPLNCGTPPANSLRN